MKDLISILIPVKNAAPWLSECLDSILNQSLKTWEVIAVNDHSDDESSKTLEKYARQFSQIHWFENNGSGIIDALDLAFQKSNGSWIHRMDADDLMPATKLETLYTLLQVNSKAIATGKVRYFGRNPISAGYKKYEDWLNQRCDFDDHNDWIYRECVIASPNWLVHRSSIEEIGGFSQLNYPEDYDLILKWLTAGKEVLSTFKTTHLWRDHDARTSRNSTVYDQDSFFKLKLEHWVKSTFQKKKTTVVLGENRKAHKVMELLDSLNVKYRWLGIQGKANEDFSTLSAIDSPQVLVAVYPPEPQFSELKKAFEKHELNHGREYWWL